VFNDTTIKTTQFSVVVPTLNEADNIDPLLTCLFALNLPPDNFEVIFVDDGSCDGTPDKVRAWEKRANVRLVERREKPDLTASILSGVAIARSNVIVVMDADLSHPPDRLAAVVEPVLNGSYDIAVGSRYVPGGGTEGWPLHRQWLSRIGGWLARPICDVNDATSGFFAVRKDLIATIAERARGYKILLELLVAGQGKIRTVEVPICFRDRTRGISKLSFSHQWTYLQRLITLAGGTVSVSTASKFAVVGLCGVIVDTLLFQVLVIYETGLAQAHIVSFFAAATVNYALNSKWSFRSHHAGYLSWDQFSRFLMIGMFALLLRGGVLALLVYGWHVPAELAIFPAIAATAVVNYLGSAFYVFPVKENPPSLDMRWRIASVGVVVFILLLRLIYLGQAQLIPDEAYYWNYAQHMDLSFVDHPPMVAWLIWLGTAIFGDNEFGVRISAFICGLVTMGYLYALTLNLYDKSTSMRTMLLLAILPVSFAHGMLMTPDAPLLATWAATLYYMERALIAGRSSAWLGMGIAFGLGILSKYTLGLLGFAALLFMILDPTARRWLFRPHPYLAAALALLLFSPVIIWNWEHDWASFLFQSRRVVGAGMDNQFSIQYLPLHILVLLTPVGLIAATLALLSSGDHKSPYARKRSLFVWIFTGVPLAVFVVVSMFNAPRFHWTTPLWLAVLPTIAWMMGTTSDLQNVARRLRSAWKPTVVASIFFYAFVLHYVVLGIPGIPYPTLMKHYFWRETTIEVEQVVEEVRRQTGQNPIVVGMSKWSVASALSYYKQSGNDMDIRSRNMFGGSGAMYDFWSPSQSPSTRPIILVSMNRNQLEHDQLGNDLGQMLDRPGPILYRAIIRNNKQLRSVYYRIAQGYLGKVN
jgi:dolichol-phosphate mannosyltransferase